MTRAELERLLSDVSTDAVDLDPSDFAALRLQSLEQLNQLIEGTGHDQYSIGHTLVEARETVVSLINLGCLAPGFLHVPVYA